MKNYTRRIGKAVALRVRRSIDQALLLKLRVRKEASTKT